MHLNHLSDEKESEARVHAGKRAIMCTDTENSDKVLPSTA